VNIADVCARLAALERDLAVEIEGLGEFKIARAYDGVVPNNETPEFPCFLHRWSPQAAIAINSYPGGFVMDDWTVHVQCLVSEYPTEIEHWSQVASLFFIAWRALLMRNIGLGATNVTLQNIRVELEQPTIIGEEGQQRFIGFDCFLDLMLTEDFVVGVGV
jgi:hypothetical protein